MDKKKKTLKAKKKKTFIPTKGVKRGTYSSEETVETFTKVQEYIDVKIPKAIEEVSTEIKEVEARVLALIADVAAQEAVEESEEMEADEKWYAFSQEDRGVSGYSHGDRGSPLYLMRRSTRLMRGGVPTTAMRGLRRILYTVPGYGLIIAGILSFIEVVTKPILDRYAARQAIVAKVARQAERAAEQKAIVEAVLAKLEVPPEPESTYLTPRELSDEDRRRREAYRMLSPD